MPPATDRLPPRAASASSRSRTSAGIHKRRSALSRCHAKSGAALSAKIPAKAAKATSAATPAAFNGDLHREGGPASANVAAFCQQELAHGYQLVNLFTDSANPVSNHVYQKIGFKPVCKYARFDFGE